MEKKVRKYNTEFRKKLIARLDKITSIDKDKSDSYDIYMMIVDDIGNNFSNNRNGIFINMNLLSDKCIDKLIKFVDNKKNLSYLVI